MSNGTVWDLTGKAGTDQADAGSGPSMPTAADGQRAQCHFFGDAGSTRGQDGQPGGPGGNGQTGGPGDSGKDLTLTVSTFEGGITFDASGGRGGNGGNGGNGGDAGNGR